ncbi:hypothetical protein [Sphingomonas sanxanigenens]|uniref:Uncharacterized protein n=1 Tax=Sphingomonas sanxanigenens DSM 19645 = NX02 TaxID=1123269 RepID=W0AK19_9SPHN|nr:hypothetical protein [Sphingomonas sanxanigenens]AHE55990.1 hypothetical protein NX02_21800 [Sphingomonas sanxanigenens DSM 19645 = NX02]
MTPIERAARAICVRYGYDPDSDDEVGLGEDGHVNWNMFEGDARAVFAVVQSEIADLASGAEQMVEMEGSRDAQIAVDTYQRVDEWFDEALAVRGG